MRSSRADDARPSTLATSLRPRAEEPRAASGVTVKGFYMRALIKELASQGHHANPAVSYRDFGDYPVAAAHDLLLDCKQRMYPNERPSEGMRRLGWIIYPTLLSTMLGRVIFGSFGNDLLAVLRAAGRGFEVSISQVRYEPMELNERSAKVHVYDFPLFPDSFLVGVFEGAFAHYGYDEAVVSARMLSTQDVELSLSW
ncbi:MAG: hypothetical protein RLZZ450_5357 [Pseudomonadota bacterium]|jgi:uncharacterized protein (TIGR02265 family)